MGVEKSLKEHLEIPEIRFYFAAASRARVQENIEISWPGLFWVLIAGRKVGRRAKKRLEKRL
jgi:hypothetical protein